MIQVYKINSDGFYIEPVIINEDEKVPYNCTEIRPQDGLYKAQFVNGKWIESLSQDEINAFKNNPDPLSEINQLKKQQTDLIFDLMMNGVL